MQKTFITAQSLLEDSFRLASQVFEDGFRPQFIIGIWRGGAPIGIAVQEFLSLKTRLLITSQCAHRPTMASISSRKKSAYTVCTT